MLSFLIHKRLNTRAFLQQMKDRSGKMKGGEKLSLLISYRPEELKNSFAKEQCKISAGLSTLALRA